MQTRLAIRRFPLRQVPMEPVDLGHLIEGGAQPRLPRRLGESLGLSHAFGRFMDYQGGMYGLASHSRYVSRSGRPSTAWRAGRGSIRFFETAMESEQRERRSLQLDLQSALARGELSLHYQP